MRRHGLSVLQRAPGFEIGGDPRLPERYGNRSGLSYQAPPRGAESCATRRSDSSASPSACRCDRLQNGREAFGPSPIPAASITCRGSVPGCDVPASRGAWFVPKSMRLQPERSCSSVRRLDAVHRTDRAVSVTPGDGVGGTFRVWRRRPGATCPLWGHRLPDLTTSPECPQWRSQPTFTGRRARTPMCR